VFIYINREEMKIYPQTMILGWVAQMNGLFPTRDARCHHEVEE